MTKPDAKQTQSDEDWFAAYLAGITQVLGHASRVAPAQANCSGLLLPGERKSIEPMAARIEPDQVQAVHQSMHHVVAQAAWDDAAVRQQVLPAIARHGPIGYWIGDDSGFPKKGQHSIDLARQDCRRRGKRDNRQVAISLSVANDQASLPAGEQLYLPQAWPDDSARRAEAGVPETITFQTKGGGGHTTENKEIAHDCAERNLYGA
ncbi:IS701 family transposase [Rhodopila sp.]|uniref:IS701 family transposase n=1 Tax=Rhodopila sp. TaxID=2480087 RepID=UPI003D0ED302